MFLLLAAHQSSQQTICAKTAPAQSAAAAGHGANHAQPERKWTLCRRRYLTGHHLPEVSQCPARNRLEGNSLLEVATSSGCLLASLGHTFVNHLSRLGCVASFSFEMLEQDLAIQSAGGWQRFKCFHAFAKQNAVSDHALCSFARPVVLHHLHGCTLCCTPAMDNEQRSLLSAHSCLIHRQFRPISPEMLMVLCT